MRVNFRSEHKYSNHGLKCEKIRMSLTFGTANSSGKRFSIDDAFEEETDEAIRVYGSTETCSVNNISRVSQDSSCSERELGNARFVYCFM